MTTILERLGCRIYGVFRATAHPQAASTTSEVLTTTTEAQLPFTTRASAAEEGLAVLEVHGGTSIEIKLWWLCDWLLSSSRTSDHEGAMGEEGVLQRDIVQVAAKFPRQALPVAS